MSPEMIRRIREMANRTWQIIGSDVLQAIEECGGNVPISRDEVIEMVGDADRMAVYGQDKEAYESYKAIDGWEAKVEILKGAFPFKKYVW